MDTKQCSKCSEVKPLERFGKAAWIKSGYLAHCKDCDNKRKRESEARLKTADPDGWRKRQRAYVAKYKQTHPERVKESDRKQSLSYKFGITIEQYDAMLERQGGKCVCGKVPGNRRLAVDHNRACCPGNKSCGKCVRGLLCGNCNTALGLLGEDKNTIERLLQYMEEYQ